MKREAARNLLIFCLVMIVVLILWVMMNDPANSDRADLSISELIDSILLVRETPRITSSAQAVIAARPALDPRLMTTNPPQVLDVQQLTYREAIARVNGMSVEGVAGVSANMPVWVVIFYTMRPESPLPGSNPDPASGNCAYVIVDAQKGLSFQSGLLIGCK